MTTLEELKPDAFETVAAWLSDPAINRWLSSEWRGRRVDGVALAIAVRNKRNRLFVVRHDGTPCGVAALADIDAADGLAMIWYVLGDSSLGGRGITTQAVVDCARVAFSDLGLRSVYAWVMEDNVASRRVLEKAGFQLAGRMRAATHSAGQQVDRLYFDLTAADLGIEQAG